MLKQVLFVHCVFVHSKHLVLNVPCILQVLRLRCCFNKWTCQASNQHHGQKHLKDSCNQRNISFCFSKPASVQPKADSVVARNTQCCSQKPVAMDARLVVQVLETMNESIPINLKWTKIRTMLANHGLCWNSKEKAEAFSLAIPATAVKFMSA